MEEAAVRHDETGGKRSWAAMALAGLALAVTAAFGWAMMGGMANAQVPNVLHPRSTASRR